MLTEQEKRWTRKDAIIQTGVIIAKDGNPVVMRELGILKNLFEYHGKTEGDVFKETYTVLDEIYQKVGYSPYLWADFWFKHGRGANHLLEMLKEIGKKTS